MNKSKLGEELRDKMEDMIATTYVEVFDKDTLYEMIRYGGLPDISGLSDVDLLEEFEMCFCIDKEDLENGNEPESIYVEATAQLAVEKMLNE